MENKTTIEKTNILIVHVDNRLSTLDYLTLTKRSIEEKVIPYLKKYGPVLSYEYQYIHIPSEYHEKIHPATAKILIVKDILEGKIASSTPSSYDVLVFLDSDAWINSPDHLNDLIIYLQSEPNKHGCFSRDPCKKINTYINSGSFILKINEYNRQLYQQIYHDMMEQDSHHHNWPYDQFYISNRIFQKKEDFVILSTEILNTPYGIILKHNWRKNNRMYYDLYEMLEKAYQFPITKPMNIFEYLDFTPFPNENDNGLNYDD